MRKKSHEKRRNIDSGRIAQKMKTREKLLSAANALMINGKEISVEQVAIEAGVSKATAYRYFSSKEILQKEASLHSISENKEDLFSTFDEADVEGRLERLIQYHHDLLTKNEIEFRLFLSAVMQDSVQNNANYSRAGRRILLIEEALISLKKKTSKERFSKVVSSISVILGIESISVLKDLCGMNNDNILETWKWMIDKIISEV
ncbi:MAG: TetR/AcrR family transcriptional regulator [Chitinophagales bacterium]|nr:TetR/AcrR family transcriptional regulator [Chitinophagales bacterium]